MRGFIFADGYFHFFVVFAEKQLQNSLLFLLEKKKRFQMKKIFFQAE